MFTAACIAAACAVLALFLVIANWWLARTATGRRRAGAPRWADTSPMPAQPARALTPLPVYPGEQTQEIALDELPAHTPQPFDDHDTTLNLPRPRPVWPPMQEQRRTPVVWGGRPASTNPAHIPVAGGTPTATHPGASEHTGETAVPEGANA